MNKKVVLLALAGVLAVVLAVGVYWFAPWKLVVDDTVDEALPAVAIQGGAQQVGPTVLAEGQFITHEHGTTGTAKLVQLPDGQRIVRIENLDTSNGPLLKVFLTDAPVIEGSDGWHVFDEGRYEDLGVLKGNKGSSNYEIPAGVDIDGLTSVSIWCDRFDVSFGAATLTAA